MSLSIPDLPPELLTPVRALTRAAYLFRGVLREAMHGRPLDSVVDEREQALLLADRVLNLWADYFGVGADADEGAGNGEAH